MHIDLLFSSLYSSMNAVHQVLKTGRICLLDVDIQGVQTVKALGMNALFFFVKPPDLETLVRPNPESLSSFL